MIPILQFPGADNRPDFDSFQSQLQALRSKAKVDRFEVEQDVDTLLMIVDAACSAPANQLCLSLRGLINEAFAAGEGRVATELAMIYRGYRFQDALNAALPALSSLKVDEEVAC